MNVKDRFSTAREALKALEHHEQAISSTVGDPPRKSKIKIERSPHTLNISDNKSFRCPFSIHFNSQYFEIETNVAFGFYKHQRYAIADIEGISNVLISNYPALKITVGIREILIPCSDQEGEWLRDIIQQWLGMGGGDS